MMEFVELSDWIWFGAVTVWLLMRIVPRLLGKGSKSTPDAAGGTAHATRPRPSGSDAFERISDPATRQRIDSEKPIEPR